MGVAREKMFVFLKSFESGLFTEDGIVWYAGAVQHMCISSPVRFHASLASY
jgi:hypothetical protein